MSKKPKTNEKRATCGLAVAPCSASFDAWWKKIKVGLPKQVSRKSMARLAWNHACFFYSQDTAIAIAQMADALCDETHKRYRRPNVKDEPRGGL